MFADLSIWHILILVAIVTLLFGTKRIPEIGASIGKGIQEFKRGLRDVAASDDAPPPPMPRTPPTTAPREQLSLPPASPAPKRLTE